MIEGSCHCGAVRIAVTAPPTELTECNCSLCRRLGGYLAYYRTDQVTVSGPTVIYIQGDRTLETHFCGTCGCHSHWRGLGEHAERSAINARLLDPAAIEGLRIRHFDGADTFTYLD